MASPPSIVWFRQDLRRSDNPALTDTTPYFRIFNPLLQGEKFDPDGAYVRQYVPELKNLPDKYLHKPWIAPQDIRAKIDYPEPVMGLEESRKRASMPLNKRKTRA